MNIDEALDALMGTLTLHLSALFNTRYPTGSDPTRWQAALELLAVTLKTHVLTDEIGDTDDALGFADVDKLDARANQLRRILRK